MGFAQKAAPAQCVVMTTTYKRRANIKIVYISLHVLHHPIDYEQRWLSNAPHTLCLQSRFVIEIIAPIAAR